MSEKIFLGVAWPYVNGPLHLGHIAGAYLPADIFARFHRMRGNRVLMVSGSDQHGTPITVRADREGRSPQDVVDEYHREFLQYWERLGISWDLYTSTGTANHIETAQEVFRLLLKQGYIYEGTQPLLYDPEAQRFLPDRYVEGTCPVCGYEAARGDQCDNCGATLDAIQLINPHSRLSGATPVVRESRHFFFRLSVFQDRLKDWAAKQTHWRHTVLNWTLGMLGEGLKDRAITRDLEWGVPVPVAGYESKRIYVWFEAVIGYLSAAREWAQRIGRPDEWREFWQDPATKMYYFVGKDNIPFHTIIWPAMLLGLNDVARPAPLLGSADLNLPYDVPANQYVTFRGQRASTSRNWAPWVSDYLEQYGTEPIRYYLTANMPETNDTDFSDTDLVRKANDELLATWGNLVHRVLTFTYRRFEQRVPEPGPLDPLSQRLLVKGDTMLEEVGRQLEACRFKASLSTAMAYATEVNRYLDERVPWRTIHEDHTATATTLFAALNAINRLKIAFYPFLPFSSERLHRYLGCEGTIEQQGWRAVPVPPGQRLIAPEPLYKKLELAPAATEEAQTPGG